MRVLMFQERFVELVRSGEKRQTIRKTARCKPGDILSLRRWMAKPYRSRHELVRIPLCKTVQAVRISMHGIEVEGCETNRDRMAVADGFQGWREMRDWFKKTHGLPFCGFLISW